MLQVRPGLGQSGSSGLLKEVALESVEHHQLAPPLSCDDQDNVTLDFHETGRSVWHGFVGSAE